MSAILAIGCFCLGYFLGYMSPTHRENHGRPGWEQLPKTGAP